MHFYVDESGHTGPNLFDPDQPMLYYGVLSARQNLDTLATKRIDRMRQRVGQPRLHATELGVGRLVDIMPDVIALVKKFELRFDVYRVAKADHAIICFFDQVFDQGMNPAVPWNGYWTPLRYVLLLKLASLFDESLARDAWRARITPNDAVALPLMQKVCRELRERIGQLPDQRSRQLIADALTWAENHPQEISFNVPSKKDMLQVTPNIVGFQSVMQGIASMLESTKMEASRIVVDRQSQFNKAQRTLADFYRKAKGLKMPIGPGLPVVDHTYVPDIPIEFSSSIDSCGLELVDIHLWIFRRVMEQTPLPAELLALVRTHWSTSRTDELSLKAIEHRWSSWFARLPELSDLSPEQLAQVAEIQRAQEERRLEYVEAAIPLQES